MRRRNLGAPAGVVPAGRRSDATRRCGPRPPTHPELGPNGGQRYPDRVTYDREAANAVLDEALSVPKDDHVEAWAGWIPLTPTPGTHVPDTITQDRAQ